MSYCPDLVATGKSQGIGWPSDSARRSVTVRPSYSGLPILPWILLESRIVHGRELTGRPV